LKKNISFNILCSIDTKPWSVGYRVLSAFVQNGERFVPEYLLSLGSKQGDFVDVASCERLWAYDARVTGLGDPYLMTIGMDWKRMQSAQYAARFSHSDIHNPNKIRHGSLTLETRFNPKTDWLPLFRDCCNSMQATIGMVHAMVEGDNLVDTQIGTKASSFYAGSFGRRNGAIAIPNIGWAMFYGKRFAADVDAERIAAAGFPIEAIGGGHLIRVTESMNDVVNDFASFSKRRAELKALFRPDMFEIPVEPPYPAEYTTALEE
jgi:hypothetical protein